MKVAVFGLGYVGTVSAACLASKGHEVCGVDLDPMKVAAFNAGRSPVVEPGLAEIVADAVTRGDLRATLSTSQALLGAEVSLICVGTPSSTQSGTDLGQIERVVEQIADGLLATGGPATGSHTVVMRSTVPPGTVDRIAARLTELVGTDGPRVGAAMCPEFLRESTAVADFFSPPFTVIAASEPTDIDTVRRLLAFLDAPVHVVGTRTAESLKYACNAFHATKVTFANEMGRVLRACGVDSREVMSLFCEDHQLNLSGRYLRPGFAFGGSCLPKDLRSLLHLGRREGIDLPLLAGTLASNRIVVNDIADRIIAGGARSVALLGLSFKQHSDDLRESPYVDLAEVLLGKGFRVSIYDPIINPSELIGVNRAYVEARLPHLHQILTNSAQDALAGAGVAVVSCGNPEVVGALLERPPARVIDLDGRLGAEVEGLPGYEGVGW